MDDEREINRVIDEIQACSYGLSAEARNALHACRPDHPLGRGQDRSELLRNAIFVMSGRRGVSSQHIEGLERIRRQLKAVAT